MIALIDADYIPFIASYDKPNEKGEIVEKTLDECIKYTNELISSIFKETKCDSYILALTVGRCFRYNIYPEYKGNRKYKQKLKYLKEVKQYLIDKWGAVFHTSLEADDIVNICRKKYGDESFIVSPDKDILGLEGNHYNPKKKEWVNTSITRAEYDFCMSLITGDSADNIKGIPGKGEVYAENVLGNKYGESDILNTVFNSYICEIKPRVKAIDEFYKNYKCLYIIDEFEDFQIPEPITIEKDIKYESEERVVKE